MRPGTVTTEAAAHPGHAVWLFLLLSSFLFADAALVADAARAQQQTLPEGLPHPVTHYNPDNSPATRQVWDIAQDSNRVVYVAGQQGGVQMFDGEHWLTVPIDTTGEGSNVGTARSVARGHDGRIYAGTNNDIGVLAPDEKGRLRFQSLLPSLHRDERQADEDGTGTVWFAGATSSATFFQTQRALYRWNGSSLDVWRSENTFHTAHVVNDRLFVRDFDRGLLELVGSTLRRVTGGDAFENRPVHALTLHPSGGMMAVTGSDGAFLLNEEGATPASIEADSVLRTTRVYAGAPVTAGGRSLYAIATLGRGVLIIDLAGNIRFHLRPGMELPDGVVNAVYEGAEGELWIGFNNEGLMRIGGLPGVEYYGDRSGLRGQIQAITRSGDALYVGTGSGLYRMRTQDPSAGPVLGTSFERVPRSAVINHLVSTSKGLVVDDLTRVWLLEPSGADQTLVRRNADFPYAPPSLPGLLIVPHMRGGLSVVRNTGGTWTSEPFDDVGPAIHSLIEHNGELWAAANPRTIMRFPLDSTPTFSTARHMQVEKKVGLPGFRFVKIRNQLAIVSRSGVYFWRPNEKTFAAEEEWMPPGVGPLRSYFHRQKEGQSDLWAVRGQRLYHTSFDVEDIRGGQTPGGRLTWEAVPGLSFRENETIRLFVAENSDVWVGRGDDLLRYRPDEGRPVPEAPTVQVRRIVAGTGQQVVSGEAPAAGFTPSLPYSMNTLKAVFAAPNFGAESPPLYRTFLKGHDTSWSDWSRKPTAEYPELVEGTYTLEIESKTVDDVVSAPARVSFVIAPPWYRSVWAYLAYLFLLGGIGAAIWTYRVALRGRREAEQQTTRTEEQLHEAQQLTRSLTRANERLRELSRMKEYFIANTSHELRTPLTNIIGFARFLKDDADSTLRPQLAVIEKNGYRLLHTLNAILDLAALRSGTIQPLLEWTDLRDPVTSVAQEMKPEVRRKGLSMAVDLPEAPVHAYVDTHFVKRIVRHLLDNAIKFTEEGLVSVSVEQGARHVQVTVADTGIGIDESFIPNLFVGFEQESRGLARAYEGSGIGLAVTGQFVSVMGGRIWVETEKGEGSTFRVRFPRRVDLDDPVAWPGDTQTKPGKPEPPESRSEVASDAIVSSRNDS